MPPKSIKTAKTGWRDVVLVCRKCQKKLDGGFGPDGDKTLKKALKKFLKPKNERKSVKVVEVKCFDLCPKGAVTAVNAARPDQYVIIPAGADLLEVKAKLGLDDGRRRLPPPEPEQGSVP